MSDYSKWKVTDLKAELKRRGIPQTGLRVKQQIVDRLLEEDAKGQGGNVDEPSAVAQDATQDATQEESHTVEPQEPTNDEDAKTPDQAQDSAAAAEPITEVKDDEQKPVEHVVPESAQPDDSTERSPPPPLSETEERSQKPQEDGKKDLEVEAGDKQPEAEATAEPVEQAPGDAEKPESIGAEREDTEQTGHTETVAPSRAQTIEVNTGLSTPLPTDELIEDSRKRKRRSQSPAPNLEELAKKRAKAPADTASGAPKQEGPISLAPETSERVTQDTSPAGEDTASHHERETKKGAPPKHDVRFKGLFAPTERDQPRTTSPPPSTEMDVEVEPALHAATAALYIDGLMRPLQPAALRSHLVSIASAAGTSPNPDSIVDFYLDPIKTHCFVSFINVSTASRVRTSLHGTVWPNERNRKGLFVDFIPESKVQEWIQREEGFRGTGGPPPRWEVKYDRTDDGVAAVLEQVDSRTAGTHGPRGAEPPKEFSRPPPRGPRAEMNKQDRRPSGQSIAADRGSRPGQGFKPLDELFKSTTTKPKLYYLPIPREVADRRLDRFDDLLQKGSYPRRGGDETRRISFEDGDLFVDTGPEYGNRVWGGRSRGRGRGRGRGGGGGMADSWRDDRRDSYQRS